MYSTVKHLHITAVVFTAGLFLLRGIWMMLDSPRLEQRWVKVVPHIVDTLLLLSALVLIFMLHQYPFVHGWLTAKVLGLLVYIGLGMIALHYGRTKRIRVLAWLAACLVFIYIVTIAVYKTPWL
ncbi:MAG: SirB2 family protein [Candidatus Competibacteraceae bacterium]